jgi:hypothetical protein
MNLNFSRKFYPEKNANTFPKEYRANRAKLVFLRKAEGKREDRKVNSFQCLSGARGL